MVPFPVCGADVEAEGQVVLPPVLPGEEVQQNFKITHTHIMDTWLCKDHDIYNIKPVLYIKVYRVIKKADFHVANQFYN